LKVGLVENGIAHTREEVRLLVCRLAETHVFNELQKHFVKRILSATPVARYCGREQQQSRPVLAVQELNFIGFSVCAAHFAVSMLRQSARTNLSKVNQSFFTRRELEGC
jgi:hypothetical protein